MTGDCCILPPVRTARAICLFWACFFTDGNTSRAEPIPNSGIASTQPSSGRFVKLDHGFMVPYQQAIPGTDVSFEMVPIPGGEFLLGSPASETLRKSDEGPQVRVAVAPFWMGKHEVTWAEYRAYMSMYEVFKKLQRLAAKPMSAAEKKSIGDVWHLIEQHSWQGDPEKDWGVDAVTSATPLYEPSFNYSAGEKPDQPAVTMTQFAARQYTKWLSGVTGLEFRLPTEGEWEYAARAGSTTAYSFGASRADLRKYAWYDANSPSGTHPIGRKQPNPWGLFDVHGNVSEWTLDEYQADTYQLLGKERVSADQAVRWPKEVYPRAIRGGSWLDSADLCRSAARQASEEDEWKLSDPNLPLSPWWYTEEPATGVGMRIIRPLKPMTSELKKRVWEPDVEAIQQDVSDRLIEGRAAIGIADGELPAAADAARKIGNE
jgi:sulfatase modifying factor 1